MRKHGARLTILAFCLLVAPTVMAEDRFGIGLKVGTYGLGQPDGEGPGREGSAGLLSQEAVR